jgi:hypothetical protein
VVAVAKQENNPTSIGLTHVVAWRGNRQALAAPVGTDEASRTLGVRSTDEDGHHDDGQPASGGCQAVEMAVADARADGVTWAKIGDALGVTHQAVIKRYRKGGAR